MTFFKRGAEKKADVDSVSTSALSALYLYVSDAGWQAQLVDGAGQPEGERRQEDCATLTGDISERLETIIGRASKAMSRADRKSIGQIHLMLGDAKTLVRDNASGELNRANASTIRQFAQQQLNCAAASFGTTAATAATVGDDSKKLLFGLTDAAGLRNALNQFDETAVKVRRVTPAAAVLARDAALNEGVYCGVIFDAYGATVVAVDGDRDCTVVRALPIGVMSLVAAVAATTRVNLAKAQTGLAQRDRLAEINLDDGAEEDGARLAKGPFHDALAPLLRGLKQEIEATLRYVVEQRMARLPERIEVLGDLDMVNGLRQWLDANLELAVVPSERDLLELFRAEDPTASMNLLTGADGPLVVVGRIRYRYTQDGFVEQNKAAPTDINIERRQRPAKRRDRNRQRGKSGSRGGQRRGRGGGGGATFFGINFGRSGQSGESGGEVELSASQERLYYLALGVFFFALLYFGYANYYGDAVKRYQRAHGAYNVALQSNKKSRRNLKESRSKAVDQALLVRRDENKVLWSEKMLAIAGHMDDKMWISDVYLTSEKATVNEQDISARKLIIEGAVLPSTHGHLLEIAQYIRRLTSDDWFMRDFSQITFEGAAIDAAEATHVVKFEINGWYDEAKRLSGDQEGGGATGKMMQKVGTRNKKMEKFQQGDFQDGKK
ncbi:MAG: hypothetical protein QF582_12645 [Alphaproteobacteria bacterium]|jgi:hypothetical protein|nr:hypothetical protein [Alphaproteobacteria bacterium]